MATSFISERSAEYILAPKLCELLKPHFKKVIPIFYWSTREGSNISRECDPSQKLKLVNVFARRPKVIIPNQESIEIKFNYTIFETARIAESVGVPTFAGSPLASSIFDLTLDTKCVWFELVKSECDVIYQISLTGEAQVSSGTIDALNGPLEENEVVSQILSKSRSMQWQEAFKNLRLIKQGSENYHFRYIFGGGYRPFHLLLLE